MVRLWWPQPARPPPQRWRQAGEHSEAPPRGAPHRAVHHMPRHGRLQRGDWERGGCSDNGHARRWMRRIGGCKGCFAGGGPRRSRRLAAIRVARGMVVVV
ncbi:hypothetical protein Tco_1301647 [Tanacetum coccineum]